MFDVSKQQSELKLAMFDISKQAKPLKLEMYWLLAGKSMLIGQHNFGRISLGNSPPTSCSVRTFWQFFPKIGTNWAIFPENWDKCNVIDCDVM